MYSGSAGQLWLHARWAGHAQWHAQSANAQLANRPGTTHVSTTAALSVSTHLHRSAQLEALLQLLAVLHAACGLVHRIAQVQMNRSGMGCRRRLKAGRAGVASNA